MGTPGDTVFLIRYHDATWERPRGVRVPCGGHLSAEEICEKVKGDDPLATINPPRRVYIEGTDGNTLDITSLTATQRKMRYMASSEPVLVKIERSQCDSNSPIPGVIEVRMTKGGSLPDLTLALPSSQGPRQRSLPIDQREASLGGFPGGSAVGLRYFDPQVGGFCRVPYGGNVPLEGTEVAQFAIELTPPISDRLSESSSSISYETEEVAHLKMAEEEGWVRQAGGVPKSVQDLQRKKCKYAMRKKGIPQKLRAPLWKMLMDCPENSPESFAPLVAATFPGIDLSAHPSFSPNPPLFGALSLDTGYFDLDPTSSRALKQLLCVVAKQHPMLSFCPLLPPCAGFLLSELSPNQAYHCLDRMLKARNPKIPHNMYLTGSSSPSSEIPGRIRVLLAKKLPRLAKVKGVCELAAACVHSLFTNTLPFYTTTRIFDLFLAEGMKVLYRFALGLLKCNEKALVDAASAEGVRLVPPPADLLFATTFSLKLSTKEVFAFTPEVPPVDTPLLGIYHRPDGSSRSSMISDPEMWESIFGWLPSEVLHGVMRVVYQQDTDGVALTSLTEVCQARIPHLVLVEGVPDRMAGTVHSELFGFFVTAPLTPNTTVEGAADSFAFSLSPAARKYSPKPDPSLRAVLSRHDMLSLGSSVGDDGGPVLLFTNGTLAKGTSSACRGYGSPSFAGGSFIVLRMEALAFDLPY